MKKGTIDPDEMLDLVDEKGKVVGKERRAICHSNPDLIHPVVHCWIFNKSAQVLWHQRSYNVDEAPGKWDMSCGGHIKSGNTPEETMKRELEEELGLRRVNFKLVDKYIKRSPTQTEFIYLYYAVINKPESYFKIDKLEVQRVMWVDPYEAQMRFVNHELESTDFIVSQVSKILQKVLDGKIR
jgi:isopentenyl-diphosphate delta-isomerase